MFQASSAHLQEDTVVYKQHMVLSLSMRVRGGLSVHSLSENSSCVPDYYLFIKYYSPLHVSSLKCSSSGGYSCIHAAYGTVTLYVSSWWPVGTQLEWDSSYVPDYYLFIKYYSPLHVSSLKFSSSGGYTCIHAAYGTVTLYESSWWPVGTLQHTPPVYPIHISLIGVNYEVWIKLWDFYGKKFLNSLCCIMALFQIYIIPFFFETSSFVFLNIMCL